MLYIVKTINGQKTKVPLSGTVATGNPVGSLLHTYKKIQPKNYLYCDGSTFDENQYPDLYLYLGTNVLPDYRECVEVGAEKNTTDIFDSTETDPSTGLPGTQSHDVFSQGEFKDDQIQNITGSIQLSATPQAITGAFGATQYAWAAPNSSGYSSNITFDASKVARTGTTTRTKEKAVFVYIKAVDGVDISDEDYFLNTVKNFVQEKNSYSTDEMLTGGTWIDGKPIYRKVAHVWHNNAVVSPYTYSNSILSYWPTNDVEMITACEGLAVRTDGYVDYFDSAVPLSTGVCPNLTNKNFYFKGWDNYQWSDCWIITEYTKSTD